MREFNRNANKVIKKRGMEKHKPGNALYPLMGNEPLVTNIETLTGVRWVACERSREARRGEGKIAVIMLRMFISMIIVDIFLLDNASPEIRVSVGMGKESVVPIRPRACVTGGFLLLY